jgi:hypothetical protein
MHAVLQPLPQNTRKQPDLWDAIQKFALLVGLLAAIKTLTD